jgi:hypothetical protein
MKDTTPVVGKKPYGKCQLNELEATVKQLAGQK